MPAKILGYMSKVIHANDRSSSIWKKESAALINGLAKFKALIEICPAVLCLVDSQVVYFLSHNNLLETNLKAKRMGTLLHLEFPNILICPIPGKANISDQLSRLFTLPKVVAESIALKNLVIPTHLEQLDNKIFTIDEARQTVSELGILHTVAQVQVRSASVEEIFSDQTGTLPETILTKKDKTLLQNVRPIQILAERLSKVNIILEQDKHAQAEPSLFGSSKDGPYELREGLWYARNKPQIFLPPSLEGVALSHAHMLCGHLGWVRLYQYMKERFVMTGMKAKCKTISTTCQACLVCNPGTLRKSPMGSVLSSYPMEIVTADLLEVEAIVGKKSHKILVICDYFTKMIYAYDLASFTSKAFLEKFKEFLASTGLVTRLLIVDNATIFSNIDVLSFLQLIGIIKIRGNANHSQSRGLVESSIRILQTLIRKLLMVSDKYDYNHILFLAPVLLNRATNPITGFSPYQMLYCRDISTLGTLGTSLTPPEYRLFSDKVKHDLEKLSSVMNERISSVRDRIQAAKNKRMESINSKRQKKESLKQGEIVFVKDFSIPRSGSARKFRPYYLRSPQVVMTATPTSVVTLRLADGFVSRHHPDDMVTYKGDNKPAELYDSLPPEVLSFLGRPLTRSSLLELSKHDQLDVIYDSQMVQESEPILTRSRKEKQLEKEHAYSLADALNDADYDDTDVDTLLLRQPPHFPPQSQHSFPTNESQRSDQLAPIPEEE